MSLDSNFLKFFQTLETKTVAQGHESCTNSAYQPLNMPPFCLESQCGPGTPCIAYPGASPPGVCDATTKKCDQNLYCSMKATEKDGNLDSVWTVDPGTGVCSTVANAQGTWCTQQNLGGTSVECQKAGSDTTCVGFWTSLDDCLAEGFKLPNSGPNPPPPGPGKCVSCGQNAKCCPVAAKEEGSFGSQTTCCANCTYSFICDGTGKTTLVKGTPTNSWANAQEATCWSCQGSSCNHVTRGAKGDYKDSTCDNACVTYYQCDPAGSGKPVATKTNTGIRDPTKINCWTCKGGNATAVAATPTNPTAQGQFATKAACLCRTCSAGGACQAVPDGSTSGTNNDNCSLKPCQATKFVCGPNGTPVGSDSSSAVAKEDLRCWSCGTNGCKAMPAGTTTQGNFNSQASCKCWTCGKGGDCSLVAAGTVGTYPSQTVCNGQCTAQLFVCDGQGNRVGSPTGVPKDQCLCWTCGDKGPVPVAEGQTNGFGTSSDATTCFSCSTAGFCVSQAGVQGKFLQANYCQNTCNATLFSCDSSGKLKPDPQGKPEAKVKCFQCDGQGKCEVVPDGSGTTMSPTCGLGCWECLPNSQDSQPVPSQVDPSKLPRRKVNPCSQDKGSQCCSDATMCKGPICTTGSSGCCDASGKPQDAACSKGQTCTSDCKCVSKSSLPSWAIGVIIGVVVIASIGMIVGIVKGIRSKKTQAQQSLARAEGDQPYSPDNQ